MQTQPHAKPLVDFLSWALILVCDERMSAAAIEVRHLSKRYPAPLFPIRRPRTAPASRSALSDLSFEVAPGEVMALIGPNGAGKSTLLRILCGLLLPSEGTARVAQLDVVRDRPRSRRAVGLALSDDRGLMPRLTVRQNLEFFAALYSLNGREAKAQIGELADRFEATQLLDRHVRTLSSGERARAVLIRTLLHRPRVLLIDELTRSLDPGAAVRLRERLIADVAGRGAAVLFASHDLSEVRSVASRVLLLSRGKVAALGAYAQVEPVAQSVFADASQEA